MGSGRILCLASLTGWDYSGAPQVLLHYFPPTCLCIDDRWSKVRVYGPSNRQLYTLRQYISRSKNKWNIFALRLRGSCAETDDELYTRKLQVIVGIPAIFPGKSPCTEHIVCRRLPSQLRWGYKYIFNRAQLGVRFNLSWRILGIGGVCPVWQSSTVKGSCGSGEI